MTKVWIGSHAGAIAGASVRCHCWSAIAGHDGWVPVPWFGAIAGGARVPLLNAIETWFRLSGAYEKTSILPSFSVNGIVEVGTLN